MAEKESIRLSAGTGEFTRVSGACNGEFGGAAVSHVAHFAFEIALSGATMLTLLLVCSFSPRVHSIPRGPRYIDCTESLFAEKERSVVALQQTSLLLRGIPANFSNLTRYAPLLFIFTIKYKHFLRI